MGARNMTPTEYTYIRELLGKKRGKVRTVAEIANRSVQTVKYIKQAQTWDRYVAIRPQGSRQRKNGIGGQKLLFTKPETRSILEKPKSNAQEILQSHTKDYSGAILAQTAALVKALYITNSTLQRVETALKKLDYPRYYATTQNGGGVSVTTGSGGHMHIVPDKPGESYGPDSIEDKPKAKSPVKYVIAGILIGAGAIIVLLNLI